MIATTAPNSRASSKQAMQQRPLAVLSPLGIGPMRALLGGRMLGRHDRVGINAIPGATAFRSPGHARLFHLRASDRAQIEKILRHCRTLGLDRVEVLVQDLQAGEQDVREAERRLRAGTALELRLREVPSSLDALRAAGEGCAQGGSPQRGIGAWFPDVHVAGDRRLAGGGRVATEAGTVHICDVFIPGANPCRMAPSSMRLPSTHASTGRIDGRTISPVCWTTAW
jgi:hypothetical protein